MAIKEKYYVIIFNKIKKKLFLEYLKYLDMIDGFEDLRHKGKTIQLVI